METYMIILLLAVGLYTVFPRNERRLLVLLKLKGSENELYSLQNIDDILKIERNLDGHLGKDDKLTVDWEYALVSKRISSEDSVEQLSRYFNQLTFIKKLEIYPFEAAEGKRVLINFIIKIKGLFVKYVTGESLSPRVGTGKEASSFLNELRTQICSEQARSQTYSSIMVNIMKKKDPDVFSIYENTCLFKLFPLVGATISRVGIPHSENWNNIAVVEYESRSGFCDMSLSTVMEANLQYKKEGLSDAQTYLTHRITHK
ncbi:uncharacterized protein LOC111703805 [Eurytemora carolleeae]|uniref:uncharacterized protein LOC111703805 n=1 Tax=Eurytemora carolleeae TaxID=1294199 RepID=UPI000C7743F2|nr:uncharacterized protein LOC111703805 [Eurytemora carolleeae]|eukprot:XP_023331636.1 uncharacterized protein LOC111703805 [Eurytemora affinis]